MNRDRSIKSMFLIIILCLVICLFLYSLTINYIARDAENLTNSTEFPHLELDNSPPPGPPNTPENFFRAGCRAAFYAGYFPFENFNTNGTLINGVLQDYYKYDTWGFSGGTKEYSCGIGKTCPPDPKPNIPWTDEQCDICATASMDNKCRWTSKSDTCYENNGIQYVPSYYGMDISECYYFPQGIFNDKKLCCHPDIKDKLVTN